MQQLFDSLPQPKELHFIPARDHFFAGALGEFEETVYNSARQAG